MSIKHQHAKQKRQQRRKTPLILRWLRYSLKFQAMLSAKWAGWRMYKLWFSSPKHPEPAREQRWRENSHQIQLPHKDGPIAIYRWGSSDRRILLIHGWSGRGPQLGAFVDPLLRKGYEVIAFDAPGHGRTPGNTSSIFRITDALTSVVNHVGPIDGVITHSFGAMVLAYAIRHAGFNTKRAVCISSPTTPEFLIDRFCEVMQVDEHVNQAFRAHVKNQFGDDVLCRLSADLNMANSDIAGLVIHDKDDHDVPYIYGQQLADAWPAAAFHLTEGLGHRRVLRNKAVIKLACDFISINT